MNEDKQTINSENNYNVNTKTHKHHRSFEDKYKLSPQLTNRYCSWVSNPTVQPDNETEMGVPIPDELNTEFSKEYGEEAKL